MGILEHVANREIGVHVARHQHRKGKRDEAELRERDRLGDGHQRGITGTGADERHRSTG